MDRDRLKEVHQSDLVEGRINQDFLDWLRTKGVTWLMFILLGLCVYFGIVRWRQHQEGYRAEAWSALSGQALPSKLEDVAEQYNDVGAVPHLARLSAAGQLVQSVQMSKTVGVTPQERMQLTPEERTTYLTRADELYATIVAADDGTPGMTLLVASALSGRASIAESNGQLEEAKAHYAKAAERVRATYPEMAARIEARAAGLDELAGAVTLRTQSENSSINIAVPVSGEPIQQLEPWLNDLVMPKDSGD